MRPNLLSNIVILALITGLGSAQSGGDYVIKDATLEGAGDASSGGNFISQIRLGQGLAGQSSGGPFAVGGGLFPEPPPPSVTAPEVPSELTAKTDLATQITLRWTDNAANEQGFLIERCHRRKNCTNFVQIAEVGPDVILFQDTGLAKNTEYRYRIRAFNTAGTSAYSNIASAKTLRK